MVDIVVLGDSQTYGYGVAHHDNWPTQFAALSGHSVYSMAVGGYGAYQYRALLDEATSLRPHLVIFALYPLNDAADLCLSQTYAVSRAHWEMVTGLPWSTCDGRSRRPRTRGGLATLTDAASENLALVSLMRHAYGEAKSYFGLRGLFFGMEAGSAVVADHGGLYAFSPSTLAARSAMVDLSDPHIEAGARQLELLLVDARNKCSRVQARVGVVLVPSRERLLEVPVLSPDLRRRIDLIRSRELELVARLTEQATALDIDVVDAECEMRRIASRGRRLYPDGEDDHPVAEGYRAIALSALRLLKSEPKSPAANRPR